VQRKCAQELGCRHSVYDLLAVRALLIRSELLRGAIGVVPHIWRPSGRFKDYMPLPATNLYQSLHTTVLHSSQPVEVANPHAGDCTAYAEEGVARTGNYKPESRDGK